MKLITNSYSIIIATILLSGCIQGNSEIDVLNTSEENYGDTIYLDWNTRPKVIKKFRREIDGDTSKFKDGDKMTLNLSLEDYVKGIDSNIEFRLKSFNNNLDYSRVCNNEFDLKIDIDPLSTGEYKAIDFSIFIFKAGAIFKFPPSSPDDWAIMHIFEDSLELQRIYFEVE